MRFASLLRCAAYCLAVGGLRTPAIAGDTLKDARDANRSAIEAIHSFYCKVTTARTPPTLSFPDVSGEYWRRGDVVRARCRAGDTQTDAVLNGSILKEIVRKFGVDGKSTAQGFLYTNWEGNTVTACDAWHLGLFTLWSGNRTNLTLDKLLELPHQLRSVTRKTDEGRELVVIDLAHELSRLTLTLDPTVGSLVRRLVQESVRDPDWRMEWEVLQFTEGAPAIFFPSEIRVRAYKKGALQNTQIVRFTNMRINHPIASGDIEVRFPKGLNVHDQARNSSYVVDTDEHPIDATMKAMASGKVAVIPNSPTTPAAPHHETLEEPPPHYWWIMPMSAGLLVLVLGWGAIVRWRRSRHA